MYYNKNMLHQPDRNIVRQSWREKLFRNSICDNACADVCVTFC